MVRDDDGASELLFQTSDTTWQAYNRWSEAGATAGYSLYEGPDGKASKVSYNRPFGTRQYPTEDWVFNAEYPMIRWLERNGYDVSYCTGIDTDRPAPRSSITRSSFRWATTNTGRGTCARTSPPPATPA